MGLLSRAARPLLLGIGVLIMLARVDAAEPSHHVIRLDAPIADIEDGLLLGNGDLSVSVGRIGDRIIWRFGKGDVWDRRFDPSDDPRPPHISEIAHGIRDEGWQCPPYGDRKPVALRGTKDAKRMEELCSGTPPSYVKRPFPCPKPVGELSLQLPLDLPDLTVTCELTIEEGLLRITARSALGFDLRLTCLVHPDTNALALRWTLAGWDDAERIGQRPPLRFSLYRWRDPDMQAFGQRFLSEFQHGAFSGFDLAKVHPLPPPTVRDFGGQRLIEQSFPADPTFPDGFRCHMAPLIDHGAVTVDDVSALGEARLTIQPEEARAAGALVIAVSTSTHDAGPEAAWPALRTAAAAALGDGLAGWVRDAVAAAQHFWARSAVHLADPLLENLWYETYHARRCTTRAGKPPPGLFLPSTVRDFSHWHGDWHTNYNLQQPFWGDYTANQLEVGDAYFDAMGYLAQMGRIIAQRYYGTRGVFIQLSGYPVTATDDMLGAVPMGRMAYMTGWAMTLYWQRYLCTLDTEWLRRTGYPMMRDCALFYTDFMAKGDDGLYHLFPSNVGEDGFTGNPKDYTDRGQVMHFARYCLRAGLAAAETLGVDADLRAAWRDRLDHCAGDDGRPPVHLTGPAQLFADANPPEFGDGRPYHPAHRGDPSQPWPGAGNWTDLWYAGQYPLITMPALRGGDFDAERGYTGLRRIIQRWRHPNGLVWAMSAANYGHAGAWTETLGICAPLQEMMLQSFGGVLRLFPYWPKSVDAEFTTFRAEGAFLVSARWSDGAIKEVEILSERGSDCRLYSPWPGGVKVETAEGQPVAVAAPVDGIHRFTTQAGERYRLAAP
jgi:hypothetical protein